jgi:hypothetical protein
MVYTKDQFKERVVKYLVNNMIYESNPMSAHDIQDEVEGGWDFAPQTIRGWLKELTQDRTSGVHAVKRPGNNYGAKKWFYFTNVDREEKQLKEIIADEENETIYTDLKDKVWDSIVDDDADPIENMLRGIEAFANDATKGFKKKDFRIIKLNLRGIEDMAEGIKMAISHRLYMDL